MFKRKISLRIFIILFFLIISIFYFFLQRNNRNKAFEIGDNKLNLIDLWQDNLYDEIYDYTKSNLEKDPTNEYFLFFFAKSAYQKALELRLDQDNLNLLDESIYAFRKLEIQNNFNLKEQIYFSLGKAYYYKGEFYYDLALQYLKKAYDKNKNIDSLLEYLALTYDKLHKEEEALELFKNIYKKNKNTLLLWNIARIYYNIEDYENAFLFNEDLLNNNLNQAQENLDKNLLQKSLKLKANIFLKQDNDSKALEYYNKILEINDKNIEVLIELGDWYEKYGDSVKARSYWREAESIIPNPFFEKIQKRLKN